MQQKLSNQEIKALLKVLDNTRDYAIITILLTTGIWLQELCALNTDDINIEKSTLSVQGSKARTIPLNPQTKDAIARWLNDRPTATSGALFLTNRGVLKELSTRSVDHLLRSSGEKAGIPSAVTSHLLRNTYTINLFSDGATIKQVSDLLGITDYYTLSKYQKLAETGNNEHPLTVSTLETRTDISKLISKVFPVNPKQAKKLSSLKVELRPDPAEVIFGREHIIKDIKAMLNKGQSVLLIGKFGVGKTHILKNIASTIQKEKVPSLSKRGRAALR